MRAGFEGSEEPTVEVPAGALLLGDAAELESIIKGPNGVLRMRPPAGWRSSGEVDLTYTQGRKRGVPRVDLLTRCQGLLVRDLAGALSATWMLLEGGANRSDLVISGTEVGAGVIAGRGVELAADARLIGPVLLGAGAVVQAGATVGPNVVLGAGAIIESGATVRSAAIEAGAIVGRGVLLQDVWVTDGKMVSATGGDPIDLRDPLLLLGGRAQGHVLGRVVAAVAAGAARMLAPTSDTAQRLGEVARGERAWLGFTSELDEPSAGAGLSAASRRAPSGLWDVEDLLVPADATTADRLRSRAWYGISKSLRVDAGLAFRLALRSVGMERS